MGTPNQQPTKIGLFRILGLFLLGALVGAVVVFLAIAQPARQKAAKLESQQQNTVETLVKFSQQRTCAAPTFDVAVAVESLVRDTMREINVRFPEDARQKIELCAENLRYAKAEGSTKPVHKKTGKKK
jgi:uncharacterized membrane protein